MKSYWNYFKGLIKHKYWVFIYCLKLNVPLRIAILHDMSKFSIKEFFPYVNNFYNSDGTKKSVRDSTGAYDTNKQSQEFKLAWINHQRNKHHWQAWCNIGDRGIITSVDIPEKYIREMISDWCGAGMSYAGVSTPSVWYSKNKNSIVMTKKSKTLLEKILKEFHEKNI